MHHELRSYLDSRIRDGVVNYWRTSAGTEVDFAVGTTAVEVKSSKTIGKEDLKGLRAIEKTGTLCEAGIGVGAAFLGDVFGVVGHSPPLRGVE